MTFNKRFWKFALVTSLLFFGGLRGAAFLILSGISLMSFWAVHPLIKRWANSQNYLPYTGFLLAITALIPLAVIRDYFGALIGFTSILWGGYAVTSHLPGKEQPKLTGKKPKALGAIQDLKHRVKDLNQALETLAQHRPRLDWASYREKAVDLLQALDQLKTDLTKQRRRLSTTTYKRLMARIETEENQLKETLTAEQAPAQPAKEPDLADLPLDIRETVLAIYADNQTIIEQVKASTSGNQAELLQLHQTNMDRFQSILTGYLAIQKSPSHYFDAQNRLDTAKTSMEAFAHSLKEQLRQLNENDMREFEVNLRLLNATTKQGDSYEPI